MRPASRTRLSSEVVRRARGGWGCGPAAHAGVVGAFGTDFAAMLAGAVCTVELATLLRSSAQTATVSQRWKHARCPCVQTAPAALLATPEIAERLSDDIARLREFESMLECVSVALDPSSWSSSVSCEWSDPYFSGSFLLDYEFSLGLPSELYWPSRENLQSLIAALEASLPTGEPLDVSPGG